MKILSVTLGRDERLSDFILEVEKAKKQTGSGRITWLQSSATSDTWMSGAGARVRVVETILTAVIE